MKRKILILLTVLSLFLGVILIPSCGKEKQTEKKPAAPEYTGEGSNLIKNDLFGKAPSELFTLFSEALREGSDIAGSLNDYKLSAALSGKRRLALAGGVLAYSENGVVKLAASLGTDTGVKLVTLTEDGAEYVLNEGLNSANDTAFLWLPKIKDALYFAEEHFSLPKVDGENTTLGEDGIYYLSEDYVNLLVTTVFSAYRCTEMGVLPSELSPGELAEIEASALEFGEKTKLKLGFGLQMKRVQSVKLSFSVDDASAITDGEVDFIEADVEIGLDSGGEHLRFAKGFLSEKRKETESAEIDFDLSTVFNTGGKLVHISADVNAKFDGAKIGEETSGDSTDPVIGSREARLVLSLNPYSKAESINLNFSDVSYRDGEAEAAYANTAYSVRLGAFSSIEPTQISVSYTVDGVKMTLGGEAVMGNAATAPELPERAKELLGLTAQDTEQTQ